MCIVLVGNSYKRSEAKLANEYFSRFFSVADEMGLNYQKQYIRKLIHHNCNDDIISAPWRNEAGCPLGAEVLSPLVPEPSKSCCTMKGGSREAASGKTGSPSWATGLNKSTSESLPISATHSANKHYCKSFGAVSCTRYTTVRKIIRNPQFSIRNTCYTKTPFFYGLYGESLLSLFASIFR